MKWRLRKFLPNVDVTPPKGTAAFLIGLVAPGLGLLKLGLRPAAWTIFGIYLLAWTVYLAVLGFNGSSLALSAIMIIHGLCLVYVVRRNSLGTDLRARVFESVGILACLIVVYTALASVVEYFLEPVRYQNKIYVAHRVSSNARFQRGDWIVYHVNAFSQPGYRINAGISLGKIWAVPGDVVEITPDDLRINGQSLPRNLDMPDTANFTIPKGHYFVWADFAIRSHGIQQQMTIAEMRLRQGQVFCEDVQGKIFRHWFFRKQI